MAGKKRAKARRQKPAPTLPEGSEPLSGVADMRSDGFGRRVTAGVYATALEGLLGPEHVRAMQAQVMDTILQMGARDPVEELLIEQMLMVHSRVIRLTVLAHRQTHVQGLRILSEHADRASNTYRRLMLAFVEYRRPPRRGDTFAVVKQANIANQQIVQNQETRHGNATNEQGFRAAPPPAGRASEEPSALPADAAGTGISPCIRSTGASLGAIHGPQNARGQGPVATELHEAR